MNIIHFYRRSRPTTTQRKESSESLIALPFSQRTKMHFECDSRSLSLSACRCNDEHGLIRDTFLQSHVYHHDANGGYCVSLSQFLSVFFAGCSLGLSSFFSSCSSFANWRSTHDDDSSLRISFCWPTSGFMVLEFMFESLMPQICEHVDYRRCFFLLSPLFQPSSPAFSMAGARAKKIAPHV